MWLMEKSEQLHVLYWNVIYKSLEKGTIAPENSDFFAGETFLVTISTLWVAYRVILKKKSNEIDRGKA